VDANSAERCRYARCRQAFEQYCARRPRRAFFASGKRSAPQVPHLAVPAAAGGPVVPVAVIIVVVIIADKFIVKEPVTVAGVDDRTLIDG
jgi:hypothetical protein